MEAKKPSMCPIKRFQNVKSLFNSASTKTTALTQAMNQVIPKEMQNRQSDALAERLDKNRNKS